MKSITKVFVLIAGFLFAGIGCDYNNVVYDSSANNDKLMSVEDSIEVGNHVNTRLQVYPSPTADIMQISYGILTPSFVILRIENLVGDVVMVVVDGYYNAGSHTVQISLKEIGLNKGIYVVHLTTHQGSSRVLFQYKP